MAYDQFVAICKPLLYTVVMSPELCALSVAGPCTWGAGSSLTFTCPIQTLSFCGSNIINNFLYELSIIVSIFCSDPFISQELFCYCHIQWGEQPGNYPHYVYFHFWHYHKMPSAGGRQKAFSTCASHLAAITMFHGTVLFLCRVASSKNSWLMDKVGYIFYTVVSP